MNASVHMVRFPAASCARRPKFLSHPFRCPSPAFLTALSSFLFRRAPFARLFCPVRFSSCFVQPALPRRLLVFMFSLTMQDKMRKLCNARSNLESELRNIHKDNTDTLNRQDRRNNIERLVSKLKNLFSKLLKNYLTWKVKAST